MNRIDIVGCEIESVLLQAERALENAEPADASAAIREPLREVIGVLLMASGEDYAREVEALARDMEQTPEDESVARAGAWIAILERLRQRIAHRGVGADDAVPDIEIVAARTLGHLAEGLNRGSPTDLEPLRAARAQFERALLQVLKGAEGKEAWDEMGTALDRFDAHFAGSRESPFWVVAAAAMDVVRSAGTFDGEARRFVAALNLALRRIVEGASPAEPALVHAALDLIAHSNDNGARVRRVRVAAAAAGMADPALGTVQREQGSKHIAAASEALDRLFAGGDLAALTGELTAFESLCRDAGARALAAFAAEMLHATGPWRASRPDDTQGSALALALLLGESAMQVDAPCLPLLEALAAAGRALQELGEGRGAAGAWATIDARATGFDRASVIAAARAMRTGLGMAEATLEGHFRDPGVATALAPLPPVFTEIAGAFAMLGAVRAERTAHACADAVARLAAGTPPELDAFERIAEQVAALSAFVDGLVREGNAREDDHPFCFSAATAPDAALNPGLVSVPAVHGAAPPTGRPAEWIERPNDPELGPIFLDEAREVLDALGESLAPGLSAFEDRERAVTARRAFHTLKGSGRMVGLERLAQAAWCVEEVLNAHLEHGRGDAIDLARLSQATLDDVRVWVDALTREGEACVDSRTQEVWAAQIQRGEALSEVRHDEAAAPVRSPDARAASLAHLSANLYAIFAEEAARHIHALRDQSARCRRSPAAAVTHDFMLAAHTLGSACATMRLVAPSELGTALENLLVELMRAASGPLPGQLDLVDATIDALERMVEEGISHRVPVAEPALCAALAAAQSAVGSAPAAPPELAPAPEAVTPDRGPYHWAAGSRRRFRPRDELDTQLLPVFLDEAQDVVPRIGAGLRRWRQSPDATALAQEVLRELHTLKGSARMAGAMGLGELAHAMESRVEHAIAQGAASSPWFDAMDTSFDRLILLVDEIADGRQGTPQTPRAGSVSTTESTDDAITGPVRGETTRPILAAEPDGVRAALRIRADVLDRIVNQTGEVSIARARAETEVRALKSQMRELADNVIRLRAQLRDLELHAESQLQATTTLGTDAVQSLDPLEFDRYTRFQELTRMMAESLSDVTVVQQSIHKNVDDVSAALSAQALISRDLQQDLMRVRMVPFSSIAERLHRVVRQAAKELGKRANLDIHGLHAELDRVVLERITAPLEHLLRNAVTHGLESPEARSAAGKPPMGTIVIDVRQENNEIVVTHRDDGAGIDVARVRARALASGITAEGERLTDAQAMELIFRPGFSTAGEVTELAGRGVGLDVVRTEAKSLGGRVAVRSEPGMGTVFTLYLPLTLSVTRALLVKTDEHTFAFPAGMVEQVLLLSRADAMAALDAGAVDWRHARVPLQYLPRLFGATDAVPDERRRLPVLVLRAGEQMQAILVDSVTGSRDIILKNLGPQLTRLPGLIGASILPGGEIALLVNPLQWRAGAAESDAPAAAGGRGKSADTLPTILVVDDSITVRRVTQRLLSRHGYDVITAKDGLEALERLREARPAVMLVDIEMPRMDGFELTRLVRASSTLRSIPIVMITSRAADKHRRIAAEVGVDVFLGKPYSEQELLGHIQSFLRQAA